MKSESLDPRIDRMMAALYGELSESEERAFHRLLEKDPALRAEWDELQASRNVLAEWKVEESVPSFVMLGGDVPARAGTPRGAAGAGWWKRFTEAVRGLGRTPAWGLATAAIALTVFFLADSRVDDKVAEQVAALRGEMAAGQPAAETRAPGVSFEELAARPSAGGGAAGGVPGRGEILPASSDYVTRSQFNESNEQFMQSLAGLLNDYGQRKDQETLDLLQAMYERVNQQQLYDYRQLSGKLNDLGHELLLNRSLAEEKIEELLGPAEPRDPAPTQDEKE